MCKGVVIHLLTWSNDSFYCMQFDYLKSTRYQTSPQQPPTTLPPQTHIKITKRKKKQKKKKSLLIYPPRMPLKNTKKQKEIKIPTHLPHPRH